MDRKQKKGMNPNKIISRNHQIYVLILMSICIVATLYFAIIMVPSVKSEYLILTTALDLIGMAIAIILYISCCQDAFANDAEHTYFRYLVLINFFALFIDYFASRLDGIANLRPLLIILNYASYFSNILRAFLCFLFCCIVLKLSHHQRKILEKIIYPCIFAQICLFGVNVFYPFIFLVDGNGFYVSLPTEWTCYIFYLIWMFTSFVMLLISKYDFRTVCSVFIYIAFPFVVDVVNVLTAQLSCLLFISSQLSMLYMYSTIYVKRSYELERQQSELAKNQLTSMLMQVNPHFIYNTLGSISSLCYLDADVASEMTNTFARYLRGSIEAVKENGVIPFEQELEQLKLYLRIEQVRFHNLDVYYRIGSKDFKIPSLVLQPLAENAIRHGIRQKLDCKGILAIETAEDEHAHIILIKDNGAGFDPKLLQTIDMSEHHGIATVQTKLDLTGCTLSIESQPGQGSCCKIMIPKEENQL